MRKQFTARLLDLPPRPQLGATLYFDPKAQGVCLRTPSTGDPWFLYVGRDHQNKERRIRLAAWSPHGGIGLDGEKLDLDGIRDLAKIVRANLKAGREPFWAPGKAQEQALSITLQEALTLHLTSRPLAKTTAHAYKELIDDYMEDWKTRPLAEISRAECFERHAKISTDNGKAAANGVMRVFRAVWNRARRQHPELPECPTINVDFHQIKPRDFGLRADGVAAVHKAISKLEDGMADYYRVLLFTGVRRRSAAYIELAHVDLKNGVLHIAVAKGGEDRAYDLPITRQLRVILERRIEHSKAIKSKWLFPSPSESGHVEEPRIVGIPTPQAFRKLYASVASLIVPQYPLKALLNHARNMNDATQHYLHLGPKELRPHAQAVANKMEALIKGKQKKARKPKGKKEPVAEAVVAQAA